MERKLDTIVCNAWGFSSAIDPGHRYKKLLLCNTCDFCTIFEHLTMPEGPELYKNSQFVNRVCKGLIFSGKIVKSAVSVKNPDVEFPACDYSIHSESRGKEMALILTSLNSDSKGKKIKKENGSECEQKRIRILFRFGMSGKFTFGPIKDLHKHAHLNFYTKEKPVMVLSFVDVRRFVYLTVIFYQCYVLLISSDVFHLDGDTLSLRWANTRGPVPVTSPRN